ncbi:MAG TPA: YhfC family intramembrane metalloprotease [Chloroflexi bacterium]|nr:YhfC family intramembrane metalloprotease [Chloroflexota bacterium]
MLTFTLVLEIVVLLALPVAVGFWMRRRLGTAWGLFFSGALAYVAAQMVSAVLGSPLLGGLPAGPAGGLIAALIAALAQEMARYGLYRFFLRDVRAGREALMVGAGHGGAEMVIIGLLLLLTLFQFLSFRNADLTMLDLSPEEQDQIRQIVADFWTTPWFVPLLRLLHQLLIAPFHLVASLFVMWSVTQRRWDYLAGMVGLHLLLYLSQGLGPISALTVAGLFAAGSLAYLRHHWSAF